MIIPCILVLSFEFDFVWSTRYFPGVSCPQVLPCLALFYLDVYIKDYNLSLRPHLRVPVSPSCVHRDRRPVPNSKRRPLTSFCFCVLKVFILFLSFVCLSVPRQGSRHSSSCPSPRQVGVGVRRDRCEWRESTGREPSSPLIVGEVRRCPRLLPARGSREITPPSAAPNPATHIQPAVRGESQPANRGSLRSSPPDRRESQPADHGSLRWSPPDRLWLNARRPAADSMPTGPPLTQCPPDRRWLKPAGSTQARRIAADSSPPATTIPSPVDPVHTSRPGVPCVCLVVPTGTF